MFLAHSIWPVLLKIISIYFPNRLELSFRRVLAFPNAFPIDFFGLLDHGFITKSNHPLLNDLVHIPDDLYSESVTDYLIEIPVFKPNNP